MEPNHYHNGVDNFRLYPKDFHGFPIYDAAPTHQAEEGTIVLALILGSPNTYFIYTMLGRAWRSVQLT